jgi:5-methyltetrahydropteroyltriglutamate--homocysteine methyltransferase
MANEYYKDDEAFLFAIAEAMREEYKAIVDAGFLLQIDDPDLPDGWACLPDITVAEYRKYAAMRIDALNHALRDIPPEKIRLHVCWGSFHGPHHDDIPLKEIIDLIFRVRAGSYSIEASNPCHEHEWCVFESVKLPEGATLVLGVVGHCTDFIEHPDLVAERLVRYAKLVGRENVLAGTDCGLGTRVGHPSICGPNSRRWPKARGVPPRFHGAGLSRSVGRKSPARRVRRAALGGRKASEIAGC